MLFRVTGKTNPYQHSNACLYSEVVQSNQRSPSFNGSYVLQQKYPQKIIHNRSQQYFNVQVNGALFKKIPMIKVDNTKNRPSTSCFKTSSNLEYSQVSIINGNEITPKIWYESPSLKRQNIVEIQEKKKMFYKLMESKNNVIKEKQREIEKLKLLEEQNTNLLKKGYNNNIILEQKKQKQKLYYKTIQLNQQKQKYNQIYQQYLQLENKNNFHHKIIDNTKINHQLFQKQKFVQHQNIFQPIIHNIQRKTQQIKVESQQIQFNQSQNESNKQYEQHYFQQKSKSTTSSSKTNNFQQNIFYQKNTSNLYNNQILKLKDQIMHKNYMIKYLQEQCLKNKQGNHQIKFKQLQYLYQNVQKDNISLLSNLQKSQKLSNQYKTQIKNLQHQLTETKSKSLQTKQTQLSPQIPKIQQQLSLKYETKIKQLQSQLAKTVSQSKSTLAQISIKNQQVILHKQFKYQNQVNNIIDKHSKQQLILQQQLTNLSTLLIDKQNKIISIQTQNNKLKQLYQSHKQQHLKAIQQSAHTLATTKTNLQQKTSQFQILETKNTTLQNKLEEIKKTIEQKNKQKSIMMNQFKKIIKKVVKQKQQHKILINQYLSIINQNTIKQTQLHNYNQQMEAKFNSILQNKQKQIQSLINKYQNQNIKLLNIISDHQIKNLQLLKNIQQQKQISRQHKQLYQKQQQINKQYLISRQNQSQKIQIISTKQNQIKQLIINIENLKQSLSIKQNQISNKCKELQIISSQMTLLKNQLGEDKIKYKSLDKLNHLRMQKCKNLQSTLIQKENKIKQLQKNYQKMVAQLQQMTKLQTQNEQNKGIKMLFEKKIQQKQNQIKLKIQQIQQIKLSLKNKQLQLTNIRNQLNQKNQLENKLVSQTEQINSLKNTIKELQTHQMEHFQNINEKQNHIKQIQSKLIDLNEQLAQMSSKLQKLEEGQTQKNETLVIQQKESQIKLQIGNNKVTNHVKSEPQIVADYIQIDKNALLYICDLLAIEPIEGQILKSIIQFLENNYFPVQHNYKQILQLFGVSSVITDKTQQQLLSQIKTFKTTINKLLQKIATIQKLNDNIIKQNLRINKQLNRIEIKQQKIILLQNFMKDSNQNIIKNKIKELNKLFNQKEVKDEEIYQKGNQ